MIKVLIADDHDVVRAGTRALLETAQDIKVVGEASDGSAAILEYERTQPDVVVLDISMPVMDGLEACKQLVSLHPNAKILILTVHPEQHYAMRILKLGARGYLTKKASAEQLKEAVRKVARNELFVPAESTGIVLNQLLNINLPNDLLGALSDRELQVFFLLVSGRTLKEISATIHTSIKSVDNYRSRILKKFGLRRTVDLVAFAYKQNLV